MLPPNSSSNIIYKIIYNFLNNHFKYGIPECVICCDPKSYKSDYKLAKSERVPFIFTYLSKEYGHFYVNYNVNLNEQKQYIYITTKEKLSGNEYTVEIDKDNHDFTNNDRVYFDNNKRNVGRVKDYTKNKLTIVLTKACKDKMDKFRTISKIYNRSKEQYLTTIEKDVNKYHIIILKFICYILEILDKLKKNICDYIDYPTNHYLWDDTIIHHYNIINFITDTFFLESLTRHFKTDINNEKIVYNTCNIDKYINESIINKTKLIVVNSNSEGYHIEHMIPNETDIIKNNMDSYTFPECVMGNFPYKYEHCLLWSKKIVQAMKKNRPNINIGLYAISIFKKYFCFNIEKLLEDTENWDIPRQKPDIIIFNSKNEKHMYYIHQVIDLYRDELDYNKFLEKIQFEYVDEEIELDTSDYVESYEYNINELYLIDTLTFFRCLNYNILDTGLKINMEYLNNVISIIDLHKSLVFNEQMNIYNNKHKLLKTYLIPCIKNISQNYDPLLMCGTKCIPENHTIWNTLVYNNKKSIMR